MSNKSFCEYFKKSKEEYEDEIKEHKILEKFNKNPEKYKKYQEFIEGLEGVRESFSTLCEKGRKLTKEECEKLKIAGEVFENELEKWDIFMSKKRIKEYMKFIDVLKGVHFCECIKKI